eukprot:GHVS01083301.1.p1 GENE.GHVS01083301.1~~GHVS01083301.1.p1  ORF type:complete len:258 (+),score=56.81 GHVS01083301.1:288-1061(+)
MADTLPEPARHLAPYINRADELHEHCPMASFYCRLFVAEQLSLLRTQPSDAGVDKLLMDQLDKAEQLKALTNSNSDNPSVSPFTKQEFENFCLGVFKRANDDDQTGQISQSTLQRYFCAGIFLDVLGQFGPLSPEMEQKRKYSRWRATCIKRSLDKGETPPSPNDEEQEEGEGLALTDEFGKLHLSPKTTKPTTYMDNIYPHTHVCAHPQPQRVWLLLLLLCAHTQCVWLLLLLCANTQRVWLLLVDTCKTTTCATA